MNLEAQARYAARAAEFKALGGLAPARASALSRLALKTVVKVVFFFSKEREEEKLQSAVAPLRCSSPALFFASNCFVRGPKIIPSSFALSNATSEAFYSANLRLEKKKKAHHRNHHDEKKPSTINFADNRKRTASPWSPSSSPRTRPRPTCLLPSGRIR